MTDYTPAKPIEAGCMAWIIPDNHPAFNSYYSWMQVAVVRKTYHPIDAPYSYDQWWITKHGDGIDLWCCEKQLLRIDDPDLAETQRQVQEVEVVE